MIKHISKFLKICTLISVSLLILTVSLQIFARFFLAQAPSWTEEVSRLFFIFSIAFSSALALKTNHFIYLDVFYNKMKPSWKKAIDIAILIAIFALFLIIAIASIQFISMGWIEDSPSLGINMGIAFSSMFILGITICYFTTKKFIKTIKQHKP